MAQELNNWFVILDAQPAGTPPAGGIQERPGLQAVGRWATIAIYQHVAEERGPAVARAAGMEVGDEEAAAAYFRALHEYEIPDEWWLGWGARSPRPKDIKEAHMAGADALALGILRKRRKPRTRSQARREVDEIKAAILRRPLKSKSKNP